MKKLGARELPRVAPEHFLEITDAWPDEVSGQHVVAKTLAEELCNNQAWGGRSCVESGFYLRPWLEVSWQNWPGFVVSYHEMFKSDATPYADYETYMRYARKPQPDEQERQQIEEDGQKTEELKQEKSK